MGIVYSVGPYITIECVWVVWEYFVSIPVHVGSKIEGLLVVIPEKQFDYSPHLQHMQLSYENC